MRTHLVIEGKGRVAGVLVTTSNLRIDPEGSKGAPRLIPIGAIYRRPVNKEGINKSGGRERK